MKRRRRCNSIGREVVGREGRGERENKKKEKTERKKKKKHLNEKSI